MTSESLWNTRKLTDENYNWLTETAGASGEPCSGVEGAWRTIWPGLLIVHFAVKLPLHSNTTHALADPRNLVPAEHFEISHEVIREEYCGGDLNSPPRELTCGRRRALNALLVAERDHRVNARSAMARYEARGERNREQQNRDRRESDWITRLDAKE